MAKQTGGSVPRFIPPMLATLVGGPFNDPDWLFEVKWDGFRVGFAELLASVGVPLVPIGRPVRTGSRARPSGSNSSTPSPRQPRDVMCRCCAA
jgi:hypothetical protein